MNWKPSIFLGCVLLLFAGLALLLFRYPRVTDHLSSHRTEETRYSRSMEQAPDALPKRASPLDGTGREKVFQEQREKIRQLEAIGYVSGVNESHSVAGVVVYDRSRTWDSLNIYISGHAPQAVLMDMDGTVLHTWSYAYEDALGKAPPNRDARSWRYAHMYPNGDLLAIYEGRALIKVTKDSDLQWVYADRCHHQVDVTDNGLIYVLSREPKIIGEIHKTEPISDDLISVLDESGTVVNRLSILECFRNSKYYSSIYRTIAQKLKADLLTEKHAPGDVLHTNALRVLDGGNSEQSQIFRKGNVLLSMRELNMLAIVNMEKSTVEWVAWGMWVTQHDPVLLANGRMLVFDNRGYRGKSRVIEFDPFTQQVFWEYKGDPPKSFFSRVCGANQRLANGNTLITDTDNGRALEVTRGGTVVWEYMSPHRTGDHDELVARLFNLSRIPKEWKLPWLER